MKLSDYIGEFCSALELENPEGQAVTINLLIQHKHYRNILASSLKDMFLGRNAVVSDKLFADVQELHQAYCGVIRAYEEKKLEIDELMKAKKPKREIQESPKRGRIPKNKIEKAVKEVMGKQDGA